MPDSVDDHVSPSCAVLVVSDCFRRPSSFHATWSVQRDTFSLGHPLFLFPLKLPRHCLALQLPVFSWHVRETLDMNFLGFLKTNSCCSEATLRAFPFVFMSVKGICSIFLQNHVCVTSKFFVIFFLLIVTFRPSAIQYNLSICKTVSRSSRLLHKVSLIYIRPGQYSRFISLLPVQVLTYIRFVDQDLWP